jgi:hypothetical protein
MTTIFVSLIHPKKIDKWKCSKRFHAKIEKFICRQCIFHTTVTGFSFQYFVNFQKRKIQCNALCKRNYYTKYFFYPDSILLSSTFYIKFTSRVSRIQSNSQSRYWQFTCFWQHQNENETLFNGKSEFWINPQVVLTLLT